MQVLVSEMAPSLRSTNEKGDEVITFLKSDEFKVFIASVVKAETFVLQCTINDLKTELSNLKESNIELVKLFDKVDLKPTTFRDENIATSFSSKVKKSVSFNTTKTTDNKNSHRNDKNKNINTTVEQISHKETTNTSSPPTPMIIEPPQETADPADWTRVERKRRSRSNTGIIGINKEESVVRGVARLCHLHVYRLEPSMEPEQLSKFLVSGGVLDVRCEKLNSKFPESYSSFKVTASRKYYEILMKPDLWPEGVCVNRFLAHLVKKDERT